MTKTKYYDLQMDDPQDDYDVEVVNANLKKIDEQMKTRENATDALQEPEFTVAEKRENIASKEKMPKILGKIAKFFTDLKTVAFSGKYSDLDGKPAIVNNNTATEAGSALDARQANPTIEGTMANQISQLNSDLNIVTDDDFQKTKTALSQSGQFIALSAHDGTGNVSRIQTIPELKGVLQHAYSKDFGNNWDFFNVGTIPDFPIEQLLVLNNTVSSIPGFILRVSTKTGTAYDLHVGDNEFCLYKSTDNGSTWKKCWDVDINL